MNNPYEDSLSHATLDHVLQAHPPNKWFLDSGATTHLCKDKLDFTEYTPTPGRFIKGVGGQSVARLGQGTITLESRVGNHLCKITLNHVTHVPAATHNLVSISRITESGA